MRMPMNQRAERHHEIHVFVAVHAPHMGGGAAVEYHRAGFEDGAASRRGILTLDQRPPGALIPLLREMSRAGGHDVECKRNGFRPQKYRWLFLKRSCQTATIHY